MPVKKTKLLNLNCSLIFSIASRIIMVYRQPVYDNVIIVHSYEAVRELSVIATESKAEGGANTRHRGGGGERTTHSVDFLK